MAKVFTSHELKTIEADTKKKKKKKASKMAKASRKPISVTYLVDKQPICQMDIFC